MSCPRTPQALAALEAGALGDDALLARHVSGCETCARALTGAQLAALGHGAPTEAEADAAVLAALGLGPMPADLAPSDRDFLAALVEAPDGALPPAPATPGFAPGLPGTPPAERPRALSRPMAMIPPDEMLDPPPPLPAVPVALPRAARWPALLGGVGALAAALLVVVMWQKGLLTPPDETAPESPAVAAPPKAEPPAEAPDPPAPPEGPTPEAPAAPEAEGDGDEAEDGAGGTEDDVREEKAAPARTQRARPARPARKPAPRDAPAAAAEKPAPRPARRAPARKKEESTAGVDDLLGALDGSGGGAKSRGSAAPAGDPALPERLTRSQILTVVKRNARAVRACRPADTDGSTVIIDIVVAPSGQVTDAAVDGPQKGTPVGACVERVVRAFRFPPFGGEPLRLRLPLQL